MVWPVGAWLGAGPHPCPAGPGPALYIHWFLNYYFFLAFFFLLISKGGVRVRVGGLRREQQQGYLPSSPGPAGWRPHQVEAPGRPTTPATPAAELAPSLHLKSPAWTSFSHTRARTHPHNFTKMMEVTISLCLFSFLYQAIKKNTPKKENTKKPQTTKQKNCLLCPFRPVSTFPLKYFVS